MLVSISQDSHEVQFYDNSTRICDLKLFHWFFKLVELEGNQEEKELNADLSKLVGFNIDDLKSVKDTEILEYRMELFECVSERLREENLDMATNKEQNLLMFKSVYAPNLDVDPNEFLVHKHGSISNHKNSKSIEISIHDNTGNLLKIKSTKKPSNEMDHAENTGTYFIHVSLDATPTDVIAEFFKHKYGIQTSDDHRNLYRFQKSYFLNVCGTDEVFYGSEHKLSSFKVTNDLKRQNPTNSNLKCFFCC